MLRTFADGLHLAQRPIQELQRLRQSHFRLVDTSASEATAQLTEANITGAALEIVADFQASQDSEFGLTVRVGAAEETRIGYDVSARELFVDRSRSGNVSFSPRFDDRHTARLPLEHGRLKLHMFVDAYSVEVFADEHRVVLSELIFPQPTSDGIALFGDARVHSLELWTLTR
jgi:fructan beta-fructosidase